MGRPNSNAKSRKSGVGLKITNSWGDKGLRGGQQEAGVSDDYYKKLWHFLSSLFLIHETW
jgi:hypothetical protein